MVSRLIAALSGALFAALASTALHAEDWPQFGRTPQHLNTNPGETAFSAANIGALAILWKAHFGNNTSTEGGAVIAGNRLFVTGFDGKLSAFDLAGCGAASCEPLWQGATRNDITATPAVADGKVYIASADHFLYVFDAAGCGAAQCSPLWRGRLQDAAIDSSVALINGRAYVGDYGGRLYAFDAAGCATSQCNPLWTAQGIASEQFVSTPTVDDTHLFIQTTISTPDDVTGRLLAFTLADCTGTTCAPAWAADIGGPAGPLRRRSSPTAGSTSDRASDSADRTAATICSRSTPPAAARRPASR
jgi:outer membrane protein assembly factor BamB